MKASREPHPQDTTPPTTRPPSHSPTPTDQFYGSISDSSVSGMSLGRLSIVSAPEIVHRRPASSSSRGHASVSSPPSPDTVQRRQSLAATRNSPSQSKSSLHPLPQAHREIAGGGGGEYMQLRYLTENPMSEYVEICRDPAATPTVCPREGSVTPENADEGEYIHPQEYRVHSALPLRIDEEECNTTSMSLDSDDSN